MFLIKPIFVGGDPSWCWYIQNIVFISWIRFLFKKNDWIDVRNCEKLDSRRKWILFRVNENRWAPPFYRSWESLVFLYWNKPRGKLRLHINVSGNLGRRLQEKWVQSTFPDRSIGFDHWEILWKVNQSKNITLVMDTENDKYPCLKVTIN